MVDLSDFLDPEDDDPAETEDDDPAETEDVAEELVALKGRLQALADAIASTNLAVINSAQHDMASATARVQASVAALRRFHDAFAVLKGEEAEATDED